MIKIMPYRNEYLEKINVQDIQKKELAYFKEDAARTFVLVDGDMVLAIISARDIYKGRAEIMSLISKECGRKMTAMVRVLKKILDDYIEKAKMDRVECTVVEGFDNGDRLVMLLGFEYEGTMRKVLFGKNCKLFSRIGD